MYGNVPTTNCLKKPPVGRACITISAVILSSHSAALKSARTARPSAFRTTLSDLMSRCRMPLACRCSIAAARSRHTASFARTDTMRPPELCSAPKRLPRSKTERTSAYVGGTRTRPRGAMMLSCLHASRNSSSLSKRFMSLGPVILVRLTTTCLPVVVWVTTYTSEDGDVCSVRSRGPRSSGETAAIVVLVADDGEGALHRCSA